ncbi:MAG: hypothetical protein WBA93_16845 [Microcoleaceae cyanobacterium]
MATLQPKPKIIRQKFPSQPILLYRGSAELIDGENIIEGKAFIQIYWYPFPYISVKFVYSGENFGDDIELKLTDFSSKSRVKVHLSRGLIYENTKREVFGCLKESLIQGRTDNLSSVTFQIANFLRFDISNEYDFEYDEEGNETEVYRESWRFFNGQLIFDYDNWHIVLADLGNSNKIQDRLEAEGGYGITHICKVERSDGKTFDLNEGYKIIDAFIYYLSFVRGIWIAPLLLFGFDAEGNKILEEWRTPTIKADSWQSFFYSWTRDDIESVYGFPGFMKKWQDEKWQEVIQNYIQWYIESSKHTNGYNTSIVLVHSA